MADGTGGTPPPDRTRQSGQDAGGSQVGGDYGSNRATPDGTLSGRSGVVRDWITIWQSELAGMATDRELQDGWVRMVDLWAEAAQRSAALWPGIGGSDGAGGRAGAAAPPGAAAAVAAPDARDAALQRLADRVEDLERQLRRLSGGDGGKPGAG